VGRRLGRVDAVALRTVSRRDLAAAGRAGRLPEFRLFPGRLSAFGVSAAPSVTGASAFRRGVRFFGTGAAAAARAARRASSVISVVTG